MRDINRISYVMRILIALFIIIFFFFTSGCLKNIVGASQYAQEYAQNLRYVNASGTPEMLNEGFCECMVCRNSTFLFGIFTSFVGGDCKFIAPCDQRTFEMYSDPQQTTNYTLRQFMIGAGPSFADFGAANSYCYNKLSMAVHWLVGGENRPYSLPSAQRAICMLDKGVIPVYVLYSNGKDINRGRTKEIAEILRYEAREVTMGRVCGAVGPTIVTTEIDFNGTDPAVIDKVVEQIHAINEGCNDLSKNPPEINCFVAVAPKMGDTAALDAVMGKVSREEVHLLAFGINSHYDNGTCNGAYMNMEAEKFARYGLYKYGLPSVIPYVLFDANTKDATGSCTWREENVLEAYRGFFPFGVVSLLGAGVIGIAPYDFNSSATGGDPLRCNDCALGASEERLAAWYGGCQKMMEIGNRVPSAQMPIIFPNESGGYCDYGVQQDALFHIYRDAQGTDFYLPIQHKISTPENQLFRCDECLVETQNIVDLYPILRKKVPSTLPSYVCTAYPEIDYYSSQFNVDPMLARAVALGESSFDKCAIAPICKPGVKANVGYTSYDPETGEKRWTTRSCIPGSEDAYNKGYPIMYDSSDFCEFEQPSNIDKPEYTFRGLGLFQTLISPYEFWPAKYREDGKDGPYVEFYEKVKNAGGVVEPEDAKKCFNEGFNPFNSTHSACLGTLKLSNDLENARKWVDKYNNENCGVSDLFGIDSNPAKRGVLVGFVALYKYAGVWDKVGDDPRCSATKSPGECWVDDYCKIKLCAKRNPSEGCGLACTETADGTACVPNIPSERSGCNGNSRDFLEYIYCRIGNDFGVSEDDSRYNIFDKMGYYIYLRDNCPNSFCPPQRKLLDEGLKLNTEFDETQIKEDLYIIFGTPWSICRQ